MSTSTVRLLTSPMLTHASKSSKPKSNRIIPHKLIWSPDADLLQMLEPDSIFCPNSGDKIDARIKFGTAPVSMELIESLNIVELLTTERWTLEFSLEKHNFLVTTNLTVSAFSFSAELTLSTLEGSKVRRHFGTSMVLYTFWLLQTRQDRRWF